MSVKLYDDAILAKLQNWTKSTEIQVYSPDDTRRLFEVIADRTKDKAIKLPIISITRPGGYTILKPHKTPISFDGFTLEANHDQASQLNGIPISIPYQLDVYTRYLQEADEFTRNLVFNIVNYPKLEVTIPYNGRNYVHVGTLRLEPEVQDNSDIPQRLALGQFTRMSLKLNVDDAYLFDVRYRDVYSIQFDAEVSDNSMKDDAKDKNLI